MEKQKSLIKEKRKKRIVVLVICIACLLLIGIGVVAGIYIGSNQNIQSTTPVTKNTESENATSPDTTNSETDDTTNTQSEELSSQSITGYAPYDAKIEEYIWALDSANSSFDSSNCSSINGLIVNYARYSNFDLYYALYDVDTNGMSELIFSDGHNIIDIYTLYENKLIKIFKNCYFGDRVRLHILSDGTLLEEGSSSAFECSCEIYKLNPNGSLSQTDAYYYYEHPNGGTTIDYDRTYTQLTAKEYGELLLKHKSQSVFDSLDWKSLQK